MLRLRSLWLNSGVALRGLKDGSRPFPRCLISSDAPAGGSRVQAEGRRERSAAAGKASKPFGSQPLVEVTIKASLLFVVYRQ